MNFTGILLELHHDERGRALCRNLGRLAKEVGIVVFQSASLVFVVGLVMWVSLVLIVVLIVNTHGSHGVTKGTEDDVTNLVKAIEQFQLQFSDRCPRDISELKAARVRVRIKDDHWGRPFMIECSNTGIRVCSHGYDELDPEDDICHEERHDPPAPALVDAPSRHREPASLPRGVEDLAAVAS